MIHWIYLCVNTTSPENSLPRGIWNLKFVFSEACSVVQLQWALAVRRQMGDPSVMPLWSPESCLSAALCAFWALPFQSWLITALRGCPGFRHPLPSQPLFTCDVAFLIHEFSPVCDHLSPSGRDKNILCYEKLLGAWHPLPAVNLWPLPAAPRSPGRSWHWPPQILCYAIWINLKNATFNLLSFSFQLLFDNHDSHKSCLA